MPVDNRWNVSTEGEEEEEDDDDDDNQQQFMTFSLFYFRRRPKQQTATITANDTKTWNRFFFSCFTNNFKIKLKTKFC